MDFVYMFNAFIQFEISGYVEDVFVSFGLYLVF